MSRIFEVHIIDADGEGLDSFEVEVEDKADIERLTHPLAAQEYAEQIQSIIRNNWEYEDD